MLIFLSISAYAFSSEQPMIKGPSCLYSFSVSLPGWKTAKHVQKTGMFPFSSLILRAQLVGCGTHDQEDARSNSTRDTVLTHTVTLGKTLYLYCLVFIQPRKTSWQDWTIVNLVIRHQLKQSVKIDLTWLFMSAGFPQALEIMENLENHQKKFHAVINHGIWKNLNTNYHGKIMEFCEIIWWNHQ